MCATFLMVHSVQTAAVSYKCALAQNILNVRLRHIHVSA